MNSHYHFCSSDTFDCETLNTLCYNYKNVKIQTAECTTVSMDEVTSLIAQRKSPCWDFTFCQNFFFPSTNHWTILQTASPPIFPWIRHATCWYHFEAAARLIILPALHPQALCCIMATASCVGHRQKHGYLKPPSLDQACTTTSQCVDHRLRFRPTELHTQTAATTTRSKWQDSREEVPSSRMHILHILHFSSYSICDINRLSYRQSWFMTHLM